MLPKFNQSFSHYVAAEFSDREISNVKKFCLLGQIPCQELYVNPLVVSFSRTVIHKLNATVAVFNQVREEASEEKGGRKPGCSEACL